MRQCSFPKEIGLNPHSLTFSDAAATLCQCCDVQHPLQAAQGLQLPILALPPLNIVVQEQRPGMTFVIIAAVWLHLLTAHRPSCESRGLDD